jgi:STE24 endopeptidase
MNTFTLIFLAAFLFQGGMQWWLSQRQIRYIRAHRGAVPPAFHGAIPLDVHQKAADYNIARVVFERCDLLYGLTLLVLWTLGGGLELLDTAWRGAGFPPLAMGVAFIISALLLMSVLELPTSAYRTFVVEQRFGFNRTTPLLFIVDALKQGLLLVLIGTPLAALILWLMAHGGSYWWAAVWVTWMAFSVFTLWAYPRFIAPLFNRFSPLADERLRARIEALLARNGFASDGIFVMDGSLRSTHGNAYFTGYGPSKRIVFFDTLLQALEPEEIESVLAHELGHFKRKHVLKRLGWMAAMSLGGLALLGWLLDQPGFYHGLGVSTPSVHTGILLFLMLAPLLGFFFQPLLACLSRRHEFEADDFAAAQGDVGAMIRALVKLYTENASTLTPDPLYSAFHDTHPPAPVRVSHLASKSLPTTR